jgi:serine/threonine protein kinase
MNDARVDAQDREDLLDEVIAGYLRAVKKGQPPTRQQLLDRHPDLAFELASFLDDHEQINRLTTPLRAVFSPAPVPVLGDVVGNYELVAELARGGMGVVYKARQKNVQRVVALKMMRSGVRASAGELQRFRAETEAVANLDHPNIVPIYEVGEHQGQPFYTMKLIEGGNLASHIGAFRNEPRAAARLLATVAQAIHYAHQRGILHRDLKPANILLASAGPLASGGPQSPGAGPDAASAPDSSGTSGLRGPLADWVPMVTDFGLAKRVAVDSSLTQSGAIIGTPSYMAPEQASSRKGAVTTAADVYGLGAILYEMLTGRPPFRADTLMDTLRLLLEQEPDLPQTLNPKVSADLQTICLKCLEKDPARRYPSAQALAQDLQRFVQGEPIQARPVGTVERAWRWCRRKPVPAALVAVLLLFFGGGLPLVTALWAHAAQQTREAEKNLELATLQERKAKEHADEVIEQKRKVEDEKKKAEDAQRKAEQEKQKAEDAQRKAEEEKKKVEESFHLAHDAVNKFYVQIDARLAAVAGLEGLRKELGQQALQYYKEFERLGGNNPALQGELAEVQARVARIIRDTGSKAAGLEAYLKAQATYEKLVAADPSNVTYRLELAHTYSDISAIHEALGHARESTAELQKARAIFEELAAADPQSVRLKKSLAGTCNNMATFLARDGKNRDALNLFQKAIALQNEVCAAEPKNWDYDRELAMYYGNLGLLYGNLNQEIDALRSYERAHELRQKVYARDKKSPQHQLELAASYRGLGTWHRNNGKPADAEPLLQDSLNLLRTAVDANPSVTQFQHDLAKTLKELAMVQRLQQKPGDAMDSLRQARSALEKVAPLYAPGAPMQQDLGIVYFELGIGYGYQTKRDQAIEAYDKGRQVFEKLVDAHPDNLDYRYKLSLNLHNMATQYGPQGLYDKALPLLSQAITNMQIAVDRAPRNGVYRRLLSGHYSVSVDYLRKVGRLEDASVAIHQRVLLAQNDVNEVFRSAREIARIAGEVGNGKKLLSPDEEKQRRRYVDQAMSWLKQAVDLGYADVGALQKDGAFELLRPRDDFKKLLDDVTSKAKAAPPQ